jgi:hypothetical protein
MGKTLDELRARMDERPLRPGEDTDTEAKGDVRATEWYAFTKEIEELRESGRVNWAEETLAGIQETVERTQRVTDGQLRAVWNISSAETHPRRGSRRYEGYRGRGR